MEKIDGIGDDARGAVGNINSVHNDRQCDENRDNRGKSKAAFPKPAAEDVEESSLGLTQFTDGGQQARFKPKLGSRSVDLVVFGGIYQFLEGWFLHRSD